MFLPVLERIGGLLEQKGRILVAIDGRCGSGKSSLADLIAERFVCRLIHMDDFYLPPERRKRDWSEIPGGNMDLLRLEEEVLVWGKRGEPISYAPYCCREGKMGRVRILPFQNLTVVEGSYSQHPRLAPYYDLKIFLTCSAAEQEKRLRQREGERYPLFSERWIPLEERYFLQYKIPQQSDIVLDTGAGERRRS